MKRALIAASSLLLSSQVGLAQAPRPSQQVTFTASLQDAYTTLEQNVTEAAEKMPDGDYSFKPTRAPELRTFGQLWGHLANAQFSACAAALGQENPNQGTNLELRQTKPDFTKALKASFALCRKAFDMLTEKNKDDMLTRGQGQIARSALLANVVIHGNEMYGTGAVYLRLKDIVPPSTERQMRDRSTAGLTGGGPTPAPTPR